MEDAWLPQPGRDLPGYLRPDYASPPQHKHIPAAFDQLSDEGSDDSGSLVEGLRDGSRPPSPPPSERGAPPFASESVLLSRLPRASSLHADESATPSRREAILLRRQQRREWLTRRSERGDFSASHALHQLDAHAFAREQRSSPSHYVGGEPRDPQPEPEPEPEPELFNPDAWLPITTVSNGGDGGSLAVASVVPSEGGEAVANSVDAWLPSPSSRYRTATAAATAPAPAVAAAAATDPAPALSSELRLSQPKRMSLSEVVRAVQAAQMFANLTTDDEGGLGTAAAKQRQMRVLVMQELLSTEEAYVASLDDLTHHFAEPMLGAGLLSTAEYGSVFGHLPQISHFHHQLYEELKSEWDASPPAWRHELQLGGIFLRFAPYLKLYKPYVTGFNSLQHTLEKHQQSAVVQRLIRKGERKCSKRMDSLVIQPVQRIPRYKLLLQRLYEMTPSSSAEHASLGTVLETLEVILHHMNDTARHHQARERVIDLHQRLRVVDSATQSGPYGASLLYCSPSGWQERALLESLVAPHRQVVLEGIAEELWVALPGPDTEDHRPELRRAERQLILLSDVLLRVVEPPPLEQAANQNTQPDESPLFVTGVLRAPINASVTVEAMDRKSLVAEFSMALGIYYRSAGDRRADNIWTLAGDFTTRVSIDGDPQQTCYLKFADAPSQARWADALKDWGKKAFAMAAAGSVANDQVTDNLRASIAGHTTKTELEGWLSFESSRQAAWETRWFVIRSQYLLAFNTPSAYAGEPLMIIDLTKSALRRKPKNKRRAEPQAWRLDVLEDSAISGSFQLTKLILSAGPEPASRDLWLQKLEAAGCNVVR